MTANRQQLVNKSMDSNHPQIMDDFEKLFSIPWGHHWHIIGRTAYLCSTLIPALSVDHFVHQGGYFIQIDENTRLISCPFQKLFLSLPLFHANDGRKAVGCGGMTCI